jgi:hypothetical protein
MIPFSSAAYYDTVTQQHPPDPFAIYIWDNAALPRCKHFLCLVHQDCLSPAELLHRRHMIKSPTCAYCGRDETRDHLLLACPLAVGVWRAIGWPVAPHLLCFRNLLSLHELSVCASSKVMSTIVTAVLWNVWKARNSWVFKAVRLFPCSVLAAVKSDLELWANRFTAALDREALKLWLFHFHVIRVLAFFSCTPPLTKTCNTQSGMLNIFEKGVGGECYSVVCCS